MFRLKGYLMCEEIAKKIRLSDGVREAISSIDRELFVPLSLRHLAYSLDALPMEADQWISSPLTVAKMTQYLLPEGGDSVLEIGCGSGYQAMVLSKIFRRVFSIERIEKLLLEAKERIRKANAININTKFDDGQKGWVTYAPYDRILFSACVEKISDTIIEQLGDNGVLVAPVLDGQNQVIKRYRKVGNRLREPEVLEKCLFVPVLSGVMR